MRVLYPSIKPSAKHKIKVTAPHELYVEESGAQNGVPILFVHGGPGAGTTDLCRRFFDPEYYRIILFDQRGCGQSTPHLCLEKNTTKDLVDDIEAIRKHLNIDKWVLFGGSWGSTLSLVYAQTYPDKVLGLILRGIFLCRDKDFKWFYQDGAKHIFPDKWENFVSPIPEDERSDIIQAYHKRLTGKDELVRMNAAKHWALWEAQCATLHPSNELESHFSHPHTAMSLACIEAHYFINDCFLQRDQLINNAKKLNDIPSIIVHGRYDMVCPLDNAYALKEAMPNAELDIIRDGGHSAFEPGIQDALVHATQRLIPIVS
jgi:proline iminopeptidase